MRDDGRPSKARGDRRGAVHAFGKGVFLRAGERGGFRGGQGGGGDRYRLSGGYGGHRAGPGAVCRSQGRA
ncbi:MAG: hypothetical protein F4Y50_05020 [Dehalococcoidia bacterium]|nr:hypothetical protein [Dehalococcoidia bacterium]